MTRWLTGPFRRLFGRVPGVGRIGAADAAAYEKAARDAFRSATITDAVAAPTPSPAPRPAAIGTVYPTTTSAPRPDARPEDASYPLAAGVDRTSMDGASAGVARTAEALGGAVRPWAQPAPATPWAFTLDPVKADTAETVSAGVAEPIMSPWAPAVTAGASEAVPVMAASAEPVTAGAAESVAVMSAVADADSDAEWEVGVVDVAARLAQRQVGDTAPEFLMRAPPTVGLTADAFFDGLVRRVESDR